MSEHSYHSGVSVRSAVSFSATTQKNLLKEDIPEEVLFRPSYLLEFVKEHFHHENVMPDRPHPHSPLLSAAASDLFPPNESGDDDDMEDSATLRDCQELVATWKRISHQKGRKTNLARKASSAASDLFVPVHKATCPNLPGAKPSRGKDSRE